MLSHISGVSTPGTTRVGVINDRIVELGPDDVFVFGSNLSGFHGAGSAGFAMRGTSRNDWRSDVAFLDILEGRNSDRRGQWAVFGVGRGYQVGMEGRSYAIATVERPGLQGCVTLEHLYEQLGALVEFAKEHPQMRFLVVKLGATRAEGGYSYFGLGVVAKLWEKLHRDVGLPGNIVLPGCFVPSEEESHVEFPDDEPETGFCEHCKTSEVPVEFDLDIFVCAPCRKRLYTQGLSMGTCSFCKKEGVPVEEDCRGDHLCITCRYARYVRPTHAEMEAFVASTQGSRSKEIGRSMIEEDARFKENPQIAKGIRCSKYDGDCSSGCLNKAVPQCCGKWDGAPMETVIGNKPETFWIDLEKEGRPRLLPMPERTSLLSDLAGKKEVCADCGAPGGELCAEHTAGVE